jgi:aryl-alcohol dehydrogenase-like predicted oxidoreductase
MEPTTQLAGGTFKLTDDITVNRMGYGAMQLAGPGVFGPLKDHEAGIAVLQEAIKVGINHIDTSDFYGPHDTNKLIKEAIHPYPDNLCLVTIVGAKRDDEGHWLRADSADELRQQVHDNLENLGIDSIPIVNFRIHSGGEDPSGFSHESIVEQMSVLADLQSQGLIQHLGISTATPEQVKEAQAIAPIVCVQNMYNIANRDDDELIDSLNEQGIAYVPYFPLGGFSPLQSDILSDVAERLESTPMQVALAWLLQRSPNILLIPGTSSVEHLHQNIASAELSIPNNIIEELDKIGK